MEHINTLRELFEEKLRVEWDGKWASICLYDTEKLNRKAKFYEALAAEITLQTNVSVSRDTVLRFNKGEGGDSKSSLNAFSKYLGYSSYEAFALSFDSKTKRQDYLKYTVIAFLSLGLIAYFFKFWYVPNKEKKDIITVISEANLRQFTAFRDLNLKDTIRIDSFYTKTGSARKSIVTLLKQSAKCNRRIDIPIDNPSFYKIHSLRVVELSEKEAIVKTKEHWFLKWYDMKEEKYTVSYDHENEQLYELEKENETWKIKNDFFEGKATKIDY